MSGVEIDFANGSECYCNMRKELVIFKFLLLFFSEQLNDEKFYLMTEKTMP